MARQKLSKTAVEGIRPVSEDIVIWDSALPGFGVRVKPTGCEATSFNTAAGPPAPRSA